MKGFRLVTSLIITVTLLNFVGKIVSDWKGGEVAVVTSDVTRDATINVNNRLTLVRPMGNSTVLRYCNISEDDHCWEPSELSGEWIFFNSSNALINQCPGWSFGRTCGNGYAYNLECSFFSEVHHWSAEGLPPINQPFDALDACRRLGDRTVLMIGDSTMGQAWGELFNAFLPGGCQGQLKHVLSDTLVKKGLGHMNRGPHWMSSVRAIKPKIVIYSVGAHVYGEELFRNTFHELLDGAMAFQNSSDSQVTFIYKTNSPGGCAKTVSPLPPDRAALSYPPAAFKFQHRNFHGRDLYAIGQLKSRGLPFLDMRMLYGRGDAHVGSAVWPAGRKTDCLHFCSPGPISVVAPLFYNLLQTELALNMSLSRKNHSI